MSRLGYFLSVHVPKRDVGSQEVSVCPASDCAETWLIGRLQVQADGQLARRGLRSAALQSNAPSPSQEASQNVQVDGVSGFAATVVSGASDFAEKVVGSTQGFASAAQTIVDTLTTRNKAPILLMHGAIQGGWVWELPRISNGAPLVRHSLLDAPDSLTAASGPLCIPL